MTETQREGVVFSSACVQPSEGQVESAGCQSVSKPSQETAVLPFLKTPPANALTPRRFKDDPGSRSVDPRSLPGGYAVTNLDFDVTENCNLGCLYCFKGEMYGENMSLETMKRTLEWLLDASGTADTVNCNFMGGEPTMRFKQIREFVPWARRRGKARGKKVSFSMTTNLTLWTDEIRAFVDRWGFGVLMSIDGCPEVQDAQRPSKNGKKMSEEIESWARSMLKTRPRSTARATLMPEYVHLLSKSAAYIHSIGFKEMAISAADYPRWTEDHFQSLESQFRQIVDYIFEVRKKGQDFCLVSFKYYINKLIHPRHTGKEKEIQFQHQPCGAGRGYMMVDYTGDIWPCHRFDGADAAAGAGGQFRLGNIFTPGFNHELRQAFLDFDHEEVHKNSCTTCPANPVCGGYCPAANLSDAGSIYTPHDTFCRWTQMSYKHAENLYLRIKGEGGKLFEDLIRSVADTHESGEK